MIFVEFGDKLQNRFSDDYELSVKMRKKAFMTQYKLNMQHIASTESDVCSVMAKLLYEEGWEEFYEAFPPRDIYGYRPQLQEWKEDVIKNYSVVALL